MPSPQNQLRAPKLTKRQTNLKQKHKSLFDPIFLQRMRTTSGSVAQPQPLAHLLAQRQLSALLHGAMGWICLPILVLPHLALPYSSSSMFISQSLPARSFKHISHPALHSGVSPIAAWSQTLPSRRGRPHWKHGKHHSWGLFTRWAKQNPDTAK